MDNLGKLLIYKKVDGNKKQIDTFNLQLGINSIGRPSRKKSSNIEIPDDDYLSRRHFCIDVRFDSNHNLLRYILSDNQSRNGTYLRSIASANQNKLKTDDRIIITNEDEIRAGKTYFKIEPNAEPLTHDSVLQNFSDKKISRKFVSENANQFDKKKLWQHLLFYIRLPFR
jgi:pSer/pThr/pTyr-binding forkhead associated (FHA) protein